MDEQDNGLYPPEYVAANKAQASALKSEASAHGLRFEGYLVPAVAEWVLECVEKGDFIDPAEAVFVAMQTYKELDAHPDLREEVLRRRIQRSLDDPSPGIPAGEAFAHLEEEMRRVHEGGPAHWSKVPWPA